MGVDARGFPGGLLRLDPAFAYVEPPSSWPLPWAECLMLVPNSTPWPYPVILLMHSLGYIAAAAAAAKSLRSCPTLCDPIDSSPTGSAVPGILQTRTLEWAAISFSNAWKWKGKMKSLSHVWFFTTPWTAAYQAPPSMGFSRQEY